MGRFDMCEGCEQRDGNCPFAGNQCKYDQEAAKRVDRWTALIPLAVLLFLVALVIFIKIVGE